MAGQPLNMPTALGAQRAAFLFARTESRMQHHAAPAPTAAQRAVHGNAWKEAINCVAIEGLAFGGGYKTAERQPGNCCFLPDVYNETGQRVGLWILFGDLPDGMALARKNKKNPARGELQAVQAEANVGKWGLPRGNTLVFSYSLIRGGGTGMVLPLFAIAGDGTWAVVHMRICAKGDGLTDDQLPYAAVQPQPDAAAVQDALWAAQAALAVADQVEFELLAVPPPLERPWYERPVTPPMNPWSWDLDGWLLEATAELNNIMGTEIDPHLADLLAQQ